MKSTSIPEQWRILITGITSIHGWPIFKKFSSMLEIKQLFGIRPPKMTIPSQEQVVSLCITDQEGLYAIKKFFKPTHVIHCSGVCDLDVCEARPRWASRINKGGAQAVADVFGGDCSIMYLSTDLVFSGVHPPEKGYTEEAAPDPVNVAGRTFTEAENILKSVHRSCVIRLGLPIGRSITGTKGAVDWIESRLKKGFPVTLFHDEYRSCISCDSIAAMTLRMLLIEAEGLFHLGGPEPKSLHEIGTMVACNGNYPQRLLNSISRLEEINGPPRIGNVALHSEKIARVSGIAVGSI